MRSAALSLDAILSAIACLCSTTDMGEKQVSTPFNFSSRNTGYFNQDQILNDIHERLTKLEAKVDRIYDMLEEQFDEDIETPSTFCNTLQIPSESEKIIDYMILNSKRYDVVCKNIPSYGNWIMIQRRRDGKENFYRNWESYKNGFGELTGDFFLGLEPLYRFMEGQKYQLLIRMKKAGENSYHLAHYKRFAIDNESNGYALKILGKYSGTAGDALISHWHAKFTTFDRDNDKEILENCAEVFHGAWWFTSCLESHLNGKYFANGIPEKLAHGIVWRDVTQYNSSLVEVEMLIKLVP